ncbi:ankyrin repeat and SOCS box protein 10 [Hypomesus transpacificus]|uniref:ankyrin repeat and SOCS box protein 10 n=1 Tax=Hypomesus transpacificus TaxID=137520 RepID=UPI001F079378|nr:ankyrin repeat and SOCS box protein 10 [Hypomesus transpacificus]
MSRGSFVFSPTALRSLQLDEDMLERHRYQKQLATHKLNGYLLKKEARERVAPTLVTATAPAVCHDLVIQNALYTGDKEAVQRMFPKGARTNLIIEPQGGDMRWVARGGGLWSLTYEQELTTPLHITAGRGFAECLRHLLLRGASVDLSPGGSTALHEACQSCQPECVNLLLSYGANANSLSEDGLLPLHMCTSPESIECAKYLLQFGAAINGRSLDEDDTPLHVAARNGLLGHTKLYLRYGAALEKNNDEGKTPLNSACSHPQELQDLERYLQVCRLLLEAGADVHALDQDKQSPLHMACKNVNPEVVDLLLARGACVNEMDYGGQAPMHNVLKVVCYKISHKPERVVRSLLNHGSIRVWPGALPKVLKCCCGSPRTIEALINAYTRIKVTDDWVEAVPPEVFKEHQEFYESLFSLSESPRSLQHLARWKLRNFLDGRLLEVVPKLNLPTFLNNYLLLESRDYVH